MKGENVKIEVLENNGVFDFLFILLFLLMMKVYNVVNLKNLKDMLLLFGL